MANNTAPTIQPRSIMQYITDNVHASLESNARVIRFITSAPTSFIPISQVKKISVHHINGALTVVESSRRCVSGENPPAFNHILNPTATCLLKVQWLDFTYEEIPGQRDEPDESNEDTESITHEQQVDTTVELEGSEGEAHSQEKSEYLTEVINDQEEVTADVNDNGEDEDEVEESYETTGRPRMIPLVANRNSPTK